MAWFVSWSRSAVPVERFPSFNQSSKEVVELSDRARAGKPLQAGSLPVELYLSKPRRKISHLFAACDGIPIVSKELRTLVEKWEPTPTIFHPVSLRKSKTGPVIDEYYFMNLVEPVDGMIPHLGSHIDYKLSGHGEPMFIVSRVPGVEMRLKNSEIANRHVWLDVRQIVAKGFFISDAFAAELERLGIHTIERIAPCVEV